MCELKIDSDLYFPTRELSAGVDLFGSGRTRLSEMWAGGPLWSGACWSRAGGSGETVAGLLEETSEGLWVYSNLKDSCLFCLKTKPELNIPTEHSNADVTMNMCN